MLFSFSRFWKTGLSLAGAWIACEFIGFELTVVALLTFLLLKNEDNSQHLF